MSLQVKEILCHETSKYQDVLIFKSETYGNVLVLDGVIQCTERDEFAYQELITHIPMTCHPNPKKVLVIGGGDGGVIREIVKHDSVEEVTLCEIDEAVIRLSKKYLPDMAVGFSHPRVTIHIGDGFPYLKDKQNTFDVIITDSSDPVAESLFQAEYFGLLKNALRECQWLHLPLISEVQGYCRSVFKVVDYAFTTIPTYPSGQIGFILCGRDDNVDFRKPIRTWSEEEEAKLFKYYNSEIHKAAFVLPQFTKNFLKSADSLVDSLKKSIFNDEKAKSATVFSLLACNNIDDQSLLKDIDITIILGNKQRPLPKPFNNRPGYDMKYVVSYINNYHPIYYVEEFEKIERSYDNLSIVKRDEKLIQWAVRVRINLQDLLILENSFLQFNWTKEAKIHTYTRRFQPSHIEGILIAYRNGDISTQRCRGVEPGCFIIQQKIPDNNQVFRVVIGEEDNYWTIITFYISSARRYWDKMCINLIKKIFNKIKPNKKNKKEFSTKNNEHDPDCKDSIYLRFIVDSVYYDDSDAFLVYFTQESDDICDEATGIASEEPSFTLNPTYDEERDVFKINFTDSAPMTTFKKTEVEDVELEIDNEGKLVTLLFHNASNKMSNISKTSV
ncbi:11318_t:CDS:10 [Entrophospora sp. SA101]|nr:11318_t:CDS:10 [Entrophospora sp. SA101]